MTTIERDALERTLSAVFHGGEAPRRELRLSEEEADYLRCYAVLTPLAAPAGDKAWYEVHLKGVS